MDSGTILAVVGAILAAFAPVIAAVVLLIQSRANMAEIKSSKAETLKKVQELHIVVNSRLSQLLELTASAAKAKGVLEGKGETSAEEKMRVHVNRPSTVIESLSVEPPKAIE